MFVGRGSCPSLDFKIWYFPIILK